MTDQTPEHALAEHPLYIETQKTIKSNLRRQENLAQAGITLDSASLLEHRLELLIGMVLPSDSLNRLEFESVFADIVSASLDDADRALAQARLAGRVPTQSGLVVAKR